jgi:UDP-N-acetylglucosamine transferase subunit ALG13
MPPPGRAPLVFVTVGTDHHPFDRLIHWMDRWLELVGPERVRCFMQTGTSARPERAPSADYLPYQELQAAMEEATVVVSHGGPSTIMGARQLGLVPVVVPRRADLGEHVDNHQVTFARKLAAAGHVALAERFQELDRVVEHALERPRIIDLDPPVARSLEAVRNFEVLVDQLVRPPRQRTALRR